MLDGLGRKIDYLRVSITDRCNLRCRYCMPHDIMNVSSGCILRYEEVLRLCGILVTLGIQTVRITGGEPLVRKDAATLLAAMRQLPGVQRLAMTTNGTLLTQEQEVLSHLDAVNISLDTLSSERYRALTGKSALDDVLKGIDITISRGLSVRINCVLMRGVNDDEIVQLAALAQDRPINVRFIELMPMGAGRDFERVSGAEVLKKIDARYALTPVLADGHGPARYYGSADLMGKVGSIDAIGGHFCAECNRIRLTSEGYLKLCLYHEDGLDLRAMLRGGATDVDMANAIERVMLRKPKGHRFGSAADEVLGGLSRIGG